MPQMQHRLSSDKHDISVTLSAFSHPDYTVGLGIPPSQPFDPHAGKRLNRNGSRTVTAGRELHPAPKNFSLILFYRFILLRSFRHVNRFAEAAKQSSQSSLLDLLFSNIRVHEVPVAVCGMPHILDLAAL